MNLADWSGNQWVNVFANEAEQILGATSDEIGQAADDELARIIEAANFKTFSFRLRAKMETYNVFQSTSSYLADLILFLFYRMKRD